MKCRTLFSRKNKEVSGNYYPAGSKVITIKIPQILFSYKKCLKVWGSGEGQEACLGWGRLAGVICCVWQLSFMEIDLKIFSKINLSLLLFQEGQLSVSGE